LVGPPGEPVEYALSTDMLDMLELVGVGASRDTTQEAKAVDTTMTAASR